MASIRTAGLAKNFGDLRAVNEIDLDLPEGGVAGVFTLIIFHFVLGRKVYRLSRQPADIVEDRGKG